MEKKTNSLLECHLNSPLVHKKADFLVKEKYKHSELLFPLRIVVFTVSSNQVPAYFFDATSVFRTLRNTGISKRKNHQK
jgi:hypothetical protein